MSGICLMVSSPLITYRPNLVGFNAVTSHVIIKLILPGSPTESKTWPQLQLFNRSVSKKLQMQQKYKFTIKKIQTHI